MKTKLFVWKGFSPDYTDGLAFAVADNEEEARELVIEDIGWSPTEWGTLTVYDDLNEFSYGFAVSGGG